MLLCKTEGYSMAKLKTVVAWLLWCMYFRTL